VLCTSQNLQESQLSISIEEDEGAKDMCFRKRKSHTDTTEKDVQNVTEMDEETM
jgi:hypothetical protein